MSDRLKVVDIVIATNSDNYLNSTKIYILQYIILIKNLN